MNPTFDDRDSFGDALQLLLNQQHNAMQTIFALSDTSRAHDAISAPAALTEILEAARQSHSTYRAMLAEIMSAQRKNCTPRGM